MTKQPPPHKNLKSAQHHWWPRSLSQYWADKDGGIHRLSWDGTVTRSQPASFGAVKNAHHIKLSVTPNPFDESFEPQFGEADSAFRKLVEWLDGLPAVQRPDGLPLERRILPVGIMDEWFKACIQCLLSLVVRSPRFRSSIRRTTEYYRQEFGLKNYKAPDHLIGLNQRNCLNNFVKAIAGRGKMCVLVSLGPEFIFGDGFFHNFTSSVDAPTRPKMVVPLTPQLAVFYTRPLSYFSEPRAMTVSLLPGEVKFLNDTVQIYAESELFFRSEKPELLDEFKKRIFLEYEYNSHPAMDCLEYVVTQRRF